MYMGLSVIYNHIVLYNCVRSVVNCNTGLCWCFGYIGKSKRINLRLCLPKNDLGLIFRKKEHCPGMICTDIYTGWEFITVDTCGLYFIIVQ